MYLISGYINVNLQLTHFSEKGVIRFSVFYFLWFVYWSIFLYYVSLDLFHSYLWRLGKRYRTYSMRYYVSLSIYLSVTKIETWFQFLHISESIVDVNTELGIANVHYTVKWSNLTLSWAHLPVWSPYLMTLTQTVLKIWIFSGNFFLVSYYLVTFGIVTDEHTDRWTDGKRHIRAHYALAQVGSKKKILGQHVAPCHMLI